MPVCWRWVWSIRGVDPIADTSRRGDAATPTCAVDMVTAYGGPATFWPAMTAEFRLAVVGRGDGKRVEQLIGPVKGGLYPHADCSVLVVRG